MRVFAVAAVCLCLGAFAAAQSVATASADVPAEHVLLAGTNVPPLRLQPLNFAQTSADASTPPKHNPAAQHLIWEAGAGFTQPNGTASDLIHMGWNIRAGAGWVFSKRFGLLGEYEFNRFGWQSPVLPSGGRENGTVHIWGLNLEPIWRYQLTKHIGGYAVLGGGFYHQATTYNNGEAGTDCNPFFGCYPTPQNGPAPGLSGSQVGANGGLGFTYKTNPAHRWAYYTEVRFEWLDTRPETAAFFPVNFGVRW